jgi:hypothetical protein
MAKNTQCFSTSYMKKSLVRSLHTAGGVRGWKFYTASCVTILPDSVQGQLYFLLWNYVVIFGALCRLSSGKKIFQEYGGIS